LEGPVATLLRASLGRRSRTCTCGNNRRNERQRWGLYFAESSAESRWLAICIIIPLHFARYVVKLMPNCFKSSFPSICCKYVRGSQSVNCSQRDDHINYLKVALQLPPIEQQVLPCELAPENHLEATRAPNAVRAIARHKTNAVQMSASPVDVRIVGRLIRI
jgi:hypothetical protein